MDVVIVFIMRPNDRRFARALQQSSSSSSSPPSSPSSSCPSSLRDGDGFRRYIFFEIGLVFYQPYCFSFLLCFNVNFFCFFYIHIILFTFGCSCGLSLYG